MTEPISKESKQTAQEAAVSTERGIAQAVDITAGGEVSPSRPGARRFEVLVDLLQDLLIAVVVCVFLITYVIQAFKVQGSSMAPELVDGERILVNKFIYHFRPIERGDVVVFWYPEDPDVSFIKRVVALPGDRVEIRRGRVILNGEQLSELYVLAENFDGRSYPAREIRPGHYFVLGDNRQGSNDSRSWGLVPHRYIYGRAFLRIWPLGKLSPVD